MTKDTSWDGLSRFEKYGMWYAMTSILVGGLLVCSLYFTIPQESKDMKNLVVLHPEWMSGAGHGKVFWYVMFGNGTRLDTTCPTDSYPFWQNSTHYKCFGADYVQVIKTEVSSEQ